MRSARDDCCQLRRAKCADIGDQRWIHDTGRPSYTATTNLYRRTSRGQNTLTIDGEDQRGYALSPLGKLGTDSGSSAADLGSASFFATVDLKNAYQQSEAGIARLHELYRGYIVDSAAKIAIVKDSIRVNEAYAGAHGPTSIEARFHTKARITLEDDGRVARLAQNGQAVKVFLGGAAPSWRFAIKGIPPHSDNPQSSLEGFSVLSLSYKVKRGRDIFVAFVSSESAAYQYGTANALVAHLDRTIPLLSKPVHRW